MKRVPIICGIGLLLALTGDSSHSAEFESALDDSLIRESAQRILSDSAFQGFDHFDTPQMHPLPTTSDSETALNTSPVESASDSSTNAGQPKTWWDRLRQHQQSKASKSGAGGDTSGSNAEAGTSDGTRSTPDGSQPGNAASKNSQGANSGSEASSSAESPSSTADRDASGGSATETLSKRVENSPRRNDESANGLERPERTASRTTPRGMPSLRGRDGVERPVRFAPKAPSPPADSSPEWNLDLGLGNFFSSIGQFLGTLFHLLAYAALAVVAVLIILLVARAITELLKHRRGQTTASTVTAVPLSDDRSPGEQAADVYLQQALQLAQSRQYHEALGQLVLGAMSAIERAQWIRYRRGLTLHDYLRSVRTRPSQFDGLRIVVQQYEPVEYGRRTASETGFQQALDGYRQGFSGVLQPAR